MTYSRFYPVLFYAVETQEIDLSPVCTRRYSGSQNHLIWMSEQQNVSDFLMSWFLTSIPAHDGAKLQNLTVTYGECSYIPVPKRLTKNISAAWAEHRCHRLFLARPSCPEEERWSSEAAMWGSNQSTCTLFSAECTHAMNPVTGLEVTTSCVHFKPQHTIFIRCPRRVNKCR